MTKRSLLCPALLLCINLFAACVQKEIPNPSNQKHPVIIYLNKNIDILPFSSTKSIPVYKPAEPFSPEETDESELFNRIDYVVYHRESGSIIKHLTLTKNNSDDFGDYIYDELEVGNYLLTLLAHNAAGVLLNGNHLTLTNMTDAFHAAEEIAVGEGNNGNEASLLLKRMVSRVEFAATKAVPAKADRFILETETQYNTISLQTGETTAHQFLRKEFLLSAGSLPGDTPNYTFYTFTPQPLQGDTSRLPGIKLTTLNLSGDTLHSINLSDIPVIKNRITRFSGNLFAPASGQSTLELEVEDYGNWKDTIHVSI